jgi:mRNA interferase HicA
MRHSIWRRRAVIKGRVAEMPIFQGKTRPRRPKCPDFRDVRDRNPPAPGCARRKASARREAAATTIRRDSVSGRGGTPHGRHNKIVYWTQQICSAHIMTSRELKRWLERQGATFEAGKGGHLKVFLNGRMSVLPMHGKGKELGTGLVNAIKRDLGLK